MSCACAVRLSGMPVISLITHAAVVGWVAQCAWMRSAGSSRSSMPRRTACGNTASERHRNGVERHVSLTMRQSNLPYSPGSLPRSCKLRRTTSFDNRNGEYCAAARSGLASACSDFSGAGLSEKMRRSSPRPASARSSRKMKTSSLQGNCEMPMATFTRPTIMP